MNASSVTALLAVLMSPAAMQHDAHTHGAWALFAALDGQDLSVTISGPLDDVLGFETAPQTAEERRAVTDLLARLRDSAPMVAVGGDADCALQGTAAVTLPEGFEPGEDDGSHGPDDHDHDHDHDDDHEHDDHDHDDDHEHDDHDHDGDLDDHAHDADHHGGDEDHDDHHADEGAHSHGGDVDVLYSFRCGRPADLSSLTFTGFSSFGSIKTVDAVFLGTNGQVAGELTPTTSTLTLR